MKKELLQVDVPTIDINQQVSAVTIKIEAATKPLGEMEKTVEGEEKWDTGVKNTHQLLNSNKEIQDKICDLEGHCRHNNIRMYVSPKGRGLLYASICGKHHFVGTGGHDEPD